MTLTGSLSLNSATVHRPTDRDTLRVAAVELSRRGLTARDVAVALGLTERAVVLLIAGKLS